MIDKVGGVILKDRKILVQRKKNNREECRIPGGKRKGNEIISLAKKLNVTKMILQPRSPSCGIGKVYSGNFNGILVEGNGILAELCIENNIEIINSEDL